ncbi:hypothetical protein D3C77_491350 [compost metagenome]
MRIARQLAGRQQVFGGIAVQFGEAGPQGRRQREGQLLEAGREAVQRLQRRGVAHGIARVEIALDLAGQLLELLGQPQVLAHQHVGALQCALRPPERGAQGQADTEQQAGDQGGQQLQAHPQPQPGF